MNSKRIAAYLTICSQDAWLARQWLAETERLGIDFAVHFDRCSPETKRHFTYNACCTGYTSNDNPEVEYTEHDKQRCFNILVENGYEWALQLDADETLEKDAVTKLPRVLESQEAAGADCVGLRYVSLWDDLEHIRVDGPFASGYHVKLYNLKGGRKWKFAEPTVNGAYLMDVSGQYKKKKGAVTETRCDLVCINHGTMTHELRVQHKQRWDAIYTRLVGNQPYQFWNYSLDYEAYPPVVVPNPYL